MEFGKFGNLSKEGWTEKPPLQIIKIGNNAHVGVRGAPAGAIVTVRPSDPTVCIAHEEPVNKTYPQWRHFLITALSDGETELTVMAQLTAGPTVSGGKMAVKVVGHTGVRLVFFPGERMRGSTQEGAIYVIGGKGESIKAAGGPSIGRGDRGGHTVEPTPAGDYVLGPKAHVVTTSWPKSVIPWGAALRINTAGEVEFQATAGKWRLATGPKGEVTRAGMAFLLRDKPKAKPGLDEVVDAVRRFFIDPTTGKLLDGTWRQNDFGRWGWNLRRNGQGTAYYIHTTPEDEATSEHGKAVFLANSHGCVHLVPTERDRLESAGYLKEGVPFEVRPYTETGPP